MCTSEHGKLPVTSFADGDNEDEVNSSTVELLLLRTLLVHQQVSTINGVLILEVDWCTTLEVSILNMEVSLLQNILITEVPLYFSSAMSYISFTQ